MSKNTKSKAPAKKSPAKAPAKKKSCALMPYLMRKHKAFYELIVEGCADMSISNYSRRGNISVAIPGAAGLKELKKAVNAGQTEKAVEIIRAHIIRFYIPDGGSALQFSKSNDKYQLGNGNFKRITIKDAKGKVIHLDGGAVIEFVEKLPGEVAIYKMKSGSMPLTGLSDLDRTKEPKFNIKEGGSLFKTNYLPKCVKEVLDKVKSNDDYKLFSVRHFHLLNHLKQENDDKFRLILATSTIYGGPTDYLLALLILNKDSDGRNLLKSWSNKLHTTGSVNTGYEKGGVKRLLNENFGQLFGNFSVNASYRGNVVKELLKGCYVNSLFKGVNSLYENLCDNNQIKVGSNILLSNIYSDSCHKCVKQMGKHFKCWTDYVRFYIAISFKSISEGSNSRNDITAFGDSLLAMFSSNKYETEMHCLNKNYLNGSIIKKDIFIKLIMFVRCGVAWLPYENLYTNDDVDTRELITSQGNLLVPCDVLDKLYGIINRVGGGDDDNKNLLDEYSPGEIVNMLKKLAGDTYNEIKNELCGTPSNDVDKQSNDIKSDNNVDEQSDDDTKSDDDDAQIDDI